MLIISTLNLLLPHKGHLYDVKLGYWNSDIVCNFFVCYGNATSYNGPDSVSQKLTEKEDAFGPKNEGPEDPLHRVQ